MPENKIDNLLRVVACLRSENGCPWDKKQDHKSLRPYLLEESYEVLEALDEYIPGDAGCATKLKDELGDLLFQVVLHAQLASERGEFTFNDIAEHLAQKLTTRHPHVFSGEKVESAAEVSALWEKRKNRDSVLAEIPKDLPALDRSLKIITKVSKVGFQWPDLKGPVEKVKEELREFLEELEKKPTNKSRLESELGDLLFCIVNTAYFLEINPEAALRTMLLRFTKRFEHVEKRAKDSGRTLESLSLDEMDIYWAEAKNKD
jgi:tetrapyrrole methylase family protein / MazG family protein